LLALSIAACMGKVARQVGAVIDLPALLTV
jgi:hypothetical protein